MVNVTVSRKKFIQVSAALPSASVTRLDALQDVDATTEVDGATLVYDADNDKYVVQRLQFSLTEASGDLDGGTF